MNDNQKRLGDVIGQRHERALADLIAARRLISHPTEKGGVTETIWLELFKKYLPERYNARQAFVVDFTGNLSHQIDIVIHDSLYTPFILEFGGHEIVPIESVYAAFEVKQDVCRKNLDYTLEKIKSVLGLKRAIRLTEKVIDCNETRILCGLLGTYSGWRKNSQARISNYRKKSDKEFNLNYVVAADQFVNSCIDGVILHDEGRAPISRFLLRFVSELQLTGTVKPINMERYLDALN